jgi:hypothetical protein
MNFTPAKLILTHIYPLVGDKLQRHAYLMPASVAKGRGWFKTYTPFTSTLNHLPVLGIGTVNL